jgi:hypothetical protein
MAFFPAASNPVSGNQSSSAVNRPEEQILRSLPPPLLQLEGVASDPKAVHPDVWNCSALSRNYARWKIILEGDPDAPFLLDLLLHGASIIPPGVEVPPAETPNYRSALSDKAHKSLDKLFSTELAEGKISIASVKPTRLHALGTVPKKGTDDLRPITDCSRPAGNSVNDLIRPVLPRFSLSSVDEVTDALSPDDFMAVTDIKAAWRSVPVRPTHRKFLGFEWALNGQPKQYFIDNCLCFGVSNAPYIFDTISRAIVRYLKKLRALGFLSFTELTVYLDDFCFVASTEEECAFAQRCLLRLLIL